MTVGHLGPPLARQGGPAGYLMQLESALAAGGAGRHRVILPARVTEPGGGPREQPPATLVTALRRLRRTWLGAPAFDRPAASDLPQPGGAADRQLQDVWDRMQKQAEPSLVRAIDEPADVLFAHDAPTAEAALRRRSGTQQVWLLLHNPMPLALYLIWCWGVPELDWQTVAAYPDVQAWMRREIDVIDAVDRVLVPSIDAAGELARGFAPMTAALARATCLMTGAAGPATGGVAVSAREGRARWALPPAVPVGLFIGNSQPYRGLDLLLAALDLVPEDVRGLVAVAGCPADRLPFHPRLKALGPVREVMDLLATVDFVINVNRFSLFDLSTIEATEAGRPLLLSPTGGNLTFRDVGAGCVLLNQLTPEAIATGLGQMFQLPTADRALLGARSRACYDAHLTPQHLRQRHVALYDAGGAGQAVAG